MYVYAYMCVYVCIYVCIFIYMYMLCINISYIVVNSGLPGSYYY